MYLRVAQKESVQFRSVAYAQPLIGPAAVGKDAAGPDAQGRRDLGARHATQNSEGDVKLTVRQARPDGFQLRLHKRRKIRLVQGTERKVPLDRLADETRNTEHSVYFILAKMAFNLWPVDAHGQSRPSMRRYDNRQSIDDSDIIVTVAAIIQVVDLVTRLPSYQNFFPQTGSKISREYLSVAIEFVVFASIPVSDHVGNRRIPPIGAGDMAGRGIGLKCEEGTSFSAHSHATQHRHDGFNYMNMLRIANRTHHTSGNVGVEFWTVLPTVNDPVMRHGLCLLLAEPTAQERSFLSRDLVRRITKIAIQTSGLLVTHLRCMSQSGAACRMTNIYNNVKGTAGVARTIRPQKRNANMSRGVRPIMTERLQLHASGRSQKAACRAGRVS
jgi:hypothetical protein